MSLRLQGFGVEAVKGVGAGFRLRLEGLGFRVQGLGFGV